jgi:hypothetical protein
MRKDTARVVTERPRYGRGSAVTKKYGGRVHIVPNSDHDYQNEIGGFHSSSRRRQKNCKQFSDNLSVIEGNLRKNVGRPWDTVHSEFCAVMDRRGLSGWHVYAQHLMRDVERKVYMGADGKVYVYGAGVRDNRKIYAQDPVTKKYGWMNNPEGKLWIHHDTKVTGYYVHPITGLLCHNPSKGYQDPYAVYHKREPKPVNYIAIKNGVLAKALRIDEANSYSYRSWVKAREYYQQEDCGRSPKTRFKAWFHYRTVTTVTVRWEPVGFVIAKNAHFTGEVINKVSPAMELYYQMRPEKYTKKEDDWWYEKKTETKEKTVKRSCNREQIAQINDHLNRV